jgi:hypothetical protein
MSATNTNTLKLLFIGGTLREMRHRSRWRRNAKIVASMLRIFVFLRGAQAGRGGVRD